MLGTRKVSDFTYLFIRCTDYFFACLSICVSMVCLVPMKARRGGNQMPWNDYELICSCWALNLDPLDEQQVLLITEPSLQPHVSDFRVN